MKSPIRIIFHNDHVVARLLQNSVEHVPSKAFKDKAIQQEMFLILDFPCPAHLAHSLRLLQPFPTPPFNSKLVRTTPQLCIQYALLPSNCPRKLLLPTKVRLNQDIASLHAFYLHSSQPEIMVHLADTCHQQRCSVFVSTSDQGQG